MRRWPVLVLLFFLLGLALPAAAAPPARSLNPTEHIHDLLDAWRIEEAAAELKPLLAARPGEPAVLLAEAHVRFHQGDYRGAIERFDRALPHVPADAADPWRALRELVASTEEATRGFEEARSPEGHFIIRYSGRDALLLPYAFAALEAARREIADRDFGVTAALGEPVRVEIYPEVADLARVSTLTLKEIETSGTIALCKWNRLMIVSPRALVRGYPWLDTLAHEYTHFVVSRATHNTVPIWLHEGLAKFEERRWRQPPGTGLAPVLEHVLASALASSRRLITFEEMYPSMAKLPSQGDTALAFAEVASAVEFIYQRKGWEGVRQALARMKQGDSDRAAVAAVMGQSFAEFQRDWQAWLRARKLRLHPGLAPPQLKFAKRAKSAAKEEDDAHEVTEERARRFTRLGGMLETRGRFSAAAVEYAKAQALVGPSNLVVANRLGRTYLALGDPERAIAAAGPAAELYPESAGLAVTLGEAWRRKGDAAKAIGHFEAALRINPFDPEPHCGLGELYPEGDPLRAQEQAACQKLRAEP